MKGTAGSANSLEKSDPCSEGSRRLGKALGALNQTLIAGTWRDQGVLAAKLVPIDWYHPDSGRRTLGLRAEVLACVTPRRGRSDPELRAIAQSREYRAVASYSRITGIGTSSAVTDSCGQIIALPS